MLEDFRANPQEKLDMENFDLVCSPLLNDCTPLFNVLADSSYQVNFYEAYIACVLFCRYAEYDERVELIFNSFDLDGGGHLDRRELSAFINASI